MERRNFIKKVCKGSLLISIPISFCSFKIKKTKTNIGIIADVHQDIIHDGISRLGVFINEMKKKKPNFIIQLGDFSLPRQQNQPFLDKWNSFDGEKYHVLGNHDFNDFGYTKKETMKWWDIDKSYYSYNCNDFKFIVLDGNDKNPEPWSGYHRYIGDKQKLWLNNELNKTLKPTIIFSHQSLEAKGGISNRKEIRKIIESHLISGNKSKVIACISGHHHTDYVKKINKIPYIQINSMSYKWVGEKYKFRRFSSKIENQFPNISKTCPYKDPLFTLITLDTHKETLNIKSRQTSFIPPSPIELKIPGAENMKARISAIDLKFNIKPNLTFGDQNEQHL